MTDKINTYILYIGFACALFCNIIYDIWQIPNVWYIGNSIALVCFTYVLNKIIKSKLTIIIFALTIGQLFDEIFGNPQKGDIIEYVSAVLVILYFIMRKKK